jgi:hypothetical protein
MEVNKVVKKNFPEPEASRLKVTSAEIAEVKRRHIERNLLYSLEETGQVLGISVRAVQELVRDGELIAANRSAARGGKVTSNVKVTAESLEIYRRSIIVPAAKWKE